MRFELNVNADNVADVLKAIERALWDLSGGKKGMRPQRRRQGAEASMRTTSTGGLHIDSIRFATAYGGPVDDLHPERARMSWQIKYPDEVDWTKRLSELQ